MPVACSPIASRWGNRAGGPPCSIAPPDIDLTLLQTKTQFLGASLVVVVGIVTQLCLTLWDSMDCSQPGSSVHEDSPGRNTGVGCHSLLQGIFPTQGSNPGLLHWQADSLPFPCSSDGKESACQCRRPGFDSWSREDATSWEATKPMCHNSWACAPESRNHKNCSLRATTSAPTTLEPVLCNKGSHLDEQSTHGKRTGAGITAIRGEPLQQQRPSTAKNKYNF